MGKFDVVVIGGAVMGSWVSYFLKTLSKNRLSVCVIERDKAYRTASCVLSAGGIRQQFSLKENVQMSMATMELMRTLEVEKGVKLIDHVGFVEEGYLFLTNTESGANTIRENAQVQRDCGAHIELLDRESLKSEFPFLETDDLVLGAFGPKNEGWFDPYLYLTAARSLSIAEGTIFKTANAVQFVTSSPEAGVPPKEIKGVRLEDGSIIECGHVINCAGAWSGNLAKSLCISLPVEPRPRSIYAIQCKDMKDTASRRCPLIIDPSGVYFRRDGTAGSGKFICGVSPGESDPDPPLEGASVEAIAYGLQNSTKQSLFEETIWPALGNRAPAFSELKVSSSWSGCYDYNTLDANAFIDTHSVTRNFSVCTGFSGHGLQMSLAAGRAMAELYLTGSFKTIDLSRFNLNRDPLFERNIV